MASQGSNSNNDLLALSSKSRKRLLVEFKKMDEVSKKNFYLKILNSVKELVSDDNVRSLSNLYLLLRDIKIEDLQNKTGLTENFNLVTLVCRNKAVKVLKYLFSKKGKTLNNLFINNCDNDCLLRDNDEFQHNAFYYAIRSNMVDLLQILIKNCSNDSSEELDDFLSNGYKELKLRGVHLSNEMELFIQSKILDIRFFHKNSNQDTSKRSSWSHIQKRIEMVVDAISFIKTNYWDASLDEKFLLKAEFTLKNIHVLKSLLKSTYNKLPWEEIEFCLTIFIHCFKNRFEANLVYNSVLNKKKILMYLETFSKALSSEEESMQNSDVIQLAKPLGRGKSLRNKAVKEILKSHPSFQDLYIDYKTVRDFYSLETMKTYADLGMSADATQKEGQLAIMRVLQVIGEHLKSTLESPKLSEETANKLFSFLPFSTREVIINLRDSLSHGVEDDTHFTRTIIKKKAHLFFKNIQTDISKINVAISDALYGIKINAIYTIVKEIRLCKCIENVNDLFRSLFPSIKSFISEEKEIVLGNITNGDVDQLEELLSCLNNSMDNQTSHEKGLFDQINSLIQKEKENIFSVRENFVYNKTKLCRIFSIFKVGNKRPLSDIYSFANSLNNLITSEESFLNIIGKLLKQLLDSAKSRMNLEMNDQLFCISLRIIQFMAFHMDNIKWIKELKGISNRKKVKKVKNEYSLITSKLFLKEILTNNNLIGDTLLRNISYFESNLELQIATEILILDVLSLLKDSNTHNTFFLDSEYPLQIGRNLRNHLAHNNALINTLLGKGTMELLLNAEKIITESLPRYDWRIDKIKSCDSFKLSKVHETDMSITDNQRKLFIALEEGDMVKIQDCLNNGADIYGTDLDRRTCLHFSAKAQNIEALMFVLQQGLDLISKDINHRTALHVAAKFDRINIVKYLVKTKLMRVDDCDILDETPLHIAINNDSKKTVKYLLKYLSDIVIEDALAHSLLKSSILKGNIEAAKIFLQRNINIVTNLSQGGYTALHLAAENGQVNFVNMLIRKKEDVESQTDLNDTPLHLAALYGHLEVVKTLILRGADINARSMADETPLHCAAQNGNMEIVKILLDHKAELNALDISFQVPLSDAARNGHVAIGEFLLRNKALVNISTENISTPLHFAAENGHYEFVQLLLSHGALIDYKNDHKKTALHYSVGKDHLTIVKLLVESGANIEIKDFNEYTPLFIAAAQGLYEITEFLIAKGADIHSKNASGATALHVAGFRGHGEITKLLLLNGANVRAKDMNNVTPIHILISNELFKLLIARKISLDFVDVHGYTILHLGALNGNLEIVKYCFEKGCNVDVRDSFGLTALHMAVRGNYQEVVSFLIDNGADINAEDMNGHTSLLFAARNNCINITDILIKKEAGTSSDRIASLCSAVWEGHHDIVTILLKLCTFDVHELQDEHSLLHKAAKNGHLIVVKVLLENGFEIDGGSKDTTNTPLHFSIFYNHFEVSQLLLSKGADPDIRDQQGMTSLHVAAMLGHTDLVQILLEEKADIFIKDSENMSVIELAILKNKLNVVKLLMEMKKVDINLKGNGGLSLLHSSALVGSLDITEYLVKNGANVNSKDINGSKPIHLATREGFKDIVEYYLNCNMEIDDLDGNNLTLLHIAATYGKVNICELLIERNADINAFNLNNETPIHLAAAKGHKDVIDILLHYGAYYNLRTNLEQTPLDETKDESITYLLKTVEKLFAAVRSNDSSEIETQLKSNVSGFCFINAKCVINDTLLHHASRNGYERIVEVLMNYKANPNIHSKDRCTPLHYAAEFSHFGIVTALLSNGAIHNTVSKSRKTPLKLAVDKHVIDVLSFLKNAFKKIRNNDISVLLDLGSMKDLSRVKTIMRAKNLEGKTLIEAATLCGFKKTEELKGLFQDDEIHFLKLADIFLKEERLMEASCAYKLIIEKRIEIFGSDNPSVLDIQVKIAKLLCMQRNYDVSISLLEEIHQKRHESLGEYHKETLAVRSLKALVLHEQKNNEEALRILKEVILKQKEILEPDDFDLLNSENGIAAVLLAMGKCAESSKISSEVLQKSNKKFGSLHMLSLSAQINLATALLKLKKFDEALSMFKKAFEISKAIFKLHHPETLRVLFCIANTLSGQEKYEECFKILRELLDIQIIYFPRNYFDILNVEFHIGKTFSDQGMTVTALRVFLALETRIATFCPNTILTEANKGEIQAIHLHFKSGGHECVFDRIKNEMENVGHDGGKYYIKNLKYIQDDMNYQYMSGITPLHVAVANDDKNKVHALLVKGVDVFKVTMEGYTALYLAAINGFTDIAMTIINYTQQHNRSSLSNLINATTTDSQSTALHVAANIDTVMCLLRHGAVFDVKNALGKTPLDLARDEKVFILFNRICDLFDRALKGDVSLLHIIKGLDPGEVSATTNARNSQGYTLLQVALFHKHKDLAKGLCELLKKKTRESVS
ncbi:ankyrin-3 [Trichonephila clavata]|uniref:Alpha-latrotoxin n=1 Tax=Trichonephila clavata TaxID=2740835 RepID=A0A8X6FAE6_TRICU|nr:ankyrin-3 [Trichonephila clavata]